MLYLSHNFYSNFNSSIESGDNEFITDMLINELSELIVYKRNELLDFLKKVEIKISANSNYDKIVDVILTEIPKNIKLIKGLAFLIAQNNEATKKTSKKETIKQIDMIASGIIGLKDSFEHKPLLKKEFKKKLLAIIKIKAKNVENKPSQNSNKDVLILLVLAAVVGIVITTFYLQKKKKEQLKIIDNPPIEPIIEEPIIPEKLMNQLNQAE